MKYIEELNRSMLWLAEKPESLLIGQAVGFDGTAVRKSLKGISSEKLKETPVFEDTQMGISIGLSLSGFFVISIFPRFNFTLLATNQIVNHLDKYKDMSNGQYQPKLIIRTVVGSEKPLFPGHQHISSFGDAFKLMCPNINVVNLEFAEQIFPEYKYAYEREDGKSSLIIEHGDRYNE